jgi:HK97 family phage major capsid protein
MEVKDAIDKIELEIKKQHDVIAQGLESQNSRVKSAIDTATKSAERIAKAEEVLEKLEAEKKDWEGRLSEMEAKSKRPGYGSAEQTFKATPGMRFLMSDEVKSAAGGRMNSTGAVDIGDFFGLKTVTVGDTGDRAPVYSERVPELFYDPGQRMMTLRDIMNIGVTNSNAIDYFLEKDFVESGAKSQNGEGGTKAQLAMQFEKKTAPVETIAAWIPVSRQVLDDQPQLQNHIDNRLAYAVNRELERQAIFGDGVSGELLGIHNTPGVQTIGAPAGTNTIIDHLRLAFAAVRASEYQATGVILNPEDWATLELTKGSDKHYIWASNPEGFGPRVWRVPVIESTVMEPGRFLTGAFGLGAQLWDRQATTIRISDSHSDNFIKNVNVVLAELRMALTVYRPKAFVKGVFNSTLST